MRRPAVPLEVVAANGVTYGTGNESVRAMTAGCPAVQRKRSAWGSVQQPPPTLSLPQCRARKRLAPWPCRPTATNRVRIRADGAETDDKQGVAVLPARRRCDYLQGTENHELL